MKERDYSYLEGKVVDYVSDDGIIKVRVVGCDFHIGITLIKETDPNGYVACLLGPMAPIRRERGWNTQPYYPALFYSLVRTIKKGLVDPYKIARIQGPTLPTSPDELATECPFGS